MNHWIKKRNLNEMIYTLCENWDGSKCLEISTRNLNFFKVFNGVSGIKVYCCDVSDETTKFSDRSLVEEKAKEIFNDNLPLSRKETEIDFLGNKPWRN